jgi:hypothetical protein
MKQALGPIESRRYYRVQYPSTLRPQLRLDGLLLAVIDLCEQGLRFAKGSAGAGELGTTLEATLQFRDGQSMTVRGSVVRITARDVAIALERGLSLNLIRREQRRLMGAARYSVH